MALLFALQLKQKRMRQLGAYICQLAISANDITNTGTTMQTQSKGPDFPTLSAPESSPWFS